MDKTVLRSTETMDDFTLLVTVYLHCRSLHPRTLESCSEVSGELYSEVVTSVDSLRTFKNSLLRRGEVLKTEGVSSGLPVEGRTRKTPVKKELSTREGVCRKGTSTS